MKNQITLQELSERLNGNYWEKGNLKRIYLDKGHNTKKMSTKTFVWQNENGEYQVSCYIDCPSQPYQWIQSQQDEIKESVLENINNIIRLLGVELVSFETIEDKNEVVVTVKEGKTESTFTEDDFYEEFGDYPVDVFGGELKKNADAMYEKNRAKRVEKAKAEKEVDKQKKEEAKKTKPSETNYGVNTVVNHGRFGNGTVISETEDKIEIDFVSDIGIKSLLKRFTKLQVVNND